VAQEASAEVDTLQHMRDALIDPHKIMIKDKMAFVFGAHRFLCWQLFGLLAGWLAWGWLGGWALGWPPAFKAGDEGQGPARPEAAP
jgi:hypothetical protein